MNIKSAIAKIVSSNNSSPRDLFEERGRVYSFINPYGYHLLRRNYELYENLDGLFIDGIFMCLLTRLYYGFKVQRRSFDMTSLAPQLFEYAENSGKTIYIVASKQEETEKAIEIFKERYPNLKFAGYRNGYFSNEEEQEKEAAYITQLNPDFLIVGMGALMQEKFLLKVKNAGYQGIGFTCGGFVHQTSKNEIDYYPKWIDKLNLRFIYRMYKEKHTRKRYMTAAFVFPFRFLAERISNQ